MSWATASLNIRHGERPSTLQEFASRHLLPRGRPFSFVGREYLETPYQDDSLRMVIMAAAQTGKSLLTTARTFYLADQGWDVGYFLDTRDRMRDHVQGYVSPLIQSSPELQNAVVDPDALNRAPRTKKGADNTRLLQFRRSGAHVYFRSMQVLGEVKAIPLDAVFLDEGAELARAVDAGLGASLIDFVPDRLLASELGFMMQVSQPGLARLDIHAAFLDSDQKEWLHRCNRGHWRDIVEDFPENIVKSPSHGWVISCKECGDHLYRWKAGKKVFAGQAREWIPKKADEEVSGYHFSQLYGPQLSPYRALETWKKAEGKPSQETRYNISILGLPHGGDRQPLSRVHIDACFDDAPLIERYDRTCIGGIDTGDTFWYLFLERTGRGLRVLNYGHTQSMPELQEIIRRMRASVIVDARPNKRDSRMLVQTARGGAICDFRSVQKPGVIQDDFVDADGIRRDVRLLKVDREAMLDEVVSSVRDRTWQIPSRAPDADLLRQHLLNLVRDPQPTRGKEVYRGGVANHFAFAMGYAMLGVQEMGQLSIASRPVTETIHIGGSEPPADPW